ncbi:MAG TPA: hypothetical protein VFW28_01335 [Micropepsaceae bacterium]|nr:hypothetical protein [Micropepsaceae bacterium]
MPWYDYLMCFFGGAFTANFVPHFVRGITGTPFPTPFAKPPGRGMSPPTLNILWSLVNLVVAYLLFFYGAFSILYLPLVLVAFVGFALMSIMLSGVFGKRLAA